MNENKKKYWLKKGRSVTTMKRKCIGHPFHVTADDFSRGEDAIKDLLESPKCPLTEEKPESVLDAESKAKADRDLKEKNAKQLTARDAKIKVNEAKELLESADSKEDKKDAEKILSEAQKELRDLEK